MIFFMPNVFKQTFGIFIGYKASLERGFVFLSKVNLIKTAKFTLLRTGIPFIARKKQMA
jgi:hypothetical protein